MINKKLSFILFIFVFLASLLIFTPQKALAVTSSWTVSIGTGDDEFNPTLPENGTVYFYKHSHGNNDLWGKSGDGLGGYTWVTESLNNSGNLNFTAWPTVTDLNGTIINPATADRNKAIGADHYLAVTTPYDSRYIGNFNSTGIANFNINGEHSSEGLNCMAARYAFAVKFADNDSGNFRFVMCQTSVGGNCNPNSGITPIVLQGGGKRFMILDQDPNQAHWPAALTSAGIPYAYMDPWIANDVHYRINVVRCTPAQACPTTPGYLGGTVANGSCGQTSCAAIPTAPTQPGTTDPLITSLQITNAGASIPGGPSQLSGKTLAENGSNYFNPITITLNATGSDNILNSSLITGYYAAFYNGSLPPDTNKDSFLSNIRTKLLASPQNHGFLLNYNISNNTHYIWDPLLKDWRPIMSSGYYLYNTSSEYIAIIHPNGTRSWKVFFYTPFGTKDFYTGAYVQETSTDKKAFRLDL